MAKRGDHRCTRNAMNTETNIGDFVFVGTRAMLLPGVTVATGAAIAAGSVVTKDVPDFAIVAGCPAKQIGRRNLQSFGYDAGYCRKFH
ncbi:MAG TPA: hypothetical protein VMT82_10585 [candidate division Zixibacteria bacterium]|nr:hypothetical protein [candidate division Zixibacteria bacterium]